MGCLTRIIKSIILCFALIGFVSIGGWDFVQKKINEYKIEQSDVVKTKASKFGDFSKLDKEYEISQTTSLFGYNGVIAEHKSSKQKMVILENKKNTEIITSEDIKNNKVEEKINKLTQKIKYSAIRIQDLKMGNKGKMIAYGEEVPYVKFSAKVTKVPFGDIEGIISAYEEEGENRLLLSINEKNKYSQIITQEFFKNIKK